MLMDLRIRQRGKRDQKNADGLRIVALVRESKTDKIVAARTRTHIRTAYEARGVRKLRRAYLTQNWSLQSR
jgi:hypothetical protein